VISKNILRMLVLPAAFMLSPAQAVVIGGWDISAFAAYDFDFDTTSGTFFVGNSTGEETAIGDTSVNTFVTAKDGSATVGLSFAAGELVDGPGFDLVLFEIGTPESMNVTVDGVDLGLFSTTAVIPAESITGTPPSGETQALNAVGIDLSGIAGIDLSDGAIIELGLTQGGADFALAGALTAVPVPAAVWLFGSGLLGLVGVARRKK